MSEGKQRWAHGEAVVVAGELLAALEGVCERVMICGSLRRLKETVGDIELVFVPRLKVMGPAPAMDFFASATVELMDMAAVAIEVLLRRGVLAKRLNVEGREMWGASNKLGGHVASGIAVDLFATTEEAWWNNVVCRTGGAASNMEIASRAKSMGWKWRSYGAGFTRRSGGDAGKVHPVRSERDVFDFVRLPYREPWERL